MARFTPDPSFYASPGAATAAPPEEVAYVAVLNTGTNGDRAPDAITVLDVKEGSPTYGQLVGRLDMPNTGDELHHFGWNACSSALCPWAPHPHVERRYLLVPGLRSSRIHVIDVKDDPRTPKIVKVIEAEEIARKAGYSRPHTVHCGPDGSTSPRSATRAATGRAASSCSTTRTSPSRAVGGRPRAAGARLRLLVAPQPRHGDHVRVGTPKMVEDGLVGELLLGNQYGHRLHVFDLESRKHVQELDLGAEHQMVLELRPAHDPAKGYGFVGVVTSTADLSASVWLWRRAEDGTVSAEKVITIPAEPAPAEELPPILQPFGAVPPLITDIALSVDDRSLLVSCWGTGTQALRRDRAARAAPDRLGAAGRDPCEDAAPRRRRAQRRTADGRDLARRPARLPDQLALRGVGRPVLPRGHRRLARRARRAGGRLARARPGRVRRVQRRAAAPGAPPGR